MIGLRKFCPNCQKGKHGNDAAYCDLCSTELKNEPNRDFYLSLHIPDSKINIEEDRDTVFCGFPFFLRMQNANSIQAVFFHEYPICANVIKYKNVIGTESTRIHVTDKMLNDFFEKGFKWHHESEMDTWY